MAKVIRENHVDTYTLECEDLTPSAAWSLDKEDPMVYVNEDREGYHPKRQWPNVPLPTVPEPQPAPGPEPAPAPEPRNEPPPAIDLTRPKSMHHMLVDWCLSLGDDPCKEYRAQKVEHLIEGVGRGDNICPVCQEKLHNAQRLKAHSGFSRYTFLSDYLTDLKLQSFLKSLN